MPASVYRDELSCCPALWQMLETGRTHSSTGRELPLHSASTLNNLVILKRLFALTQASRTLEIGLGYGASCALLAACHQASGAAPAGQHLGIDPLQTSQWEDATPALLQKAALEGYVDIRRRPSALELPCLQQDSLQFDLIYVDGSHLFEDVFVDFYFCRFLLRPGGVIAFDDSSSGHIAKVQRFIQTNLGAQFTELDLAPFRPDIGRPLTYRAAKWLGKLQMRAFQKTGPAERPQTSPLGKF